MKKYTVTFRLIHAIEVESKLEDIDLIIDKATIKLLQKCDVDQMDIEVLLVENDEGEVIVG